MAPPFPRCSIGSIGLGLNNPLTTRQGLAESVPTIYFSLCYTPHYKILASFTLRSDLLTHVSKYKMPAPGQFSYATKICIWSRPGKFPQGHFLWWATLIKAFLHFRYHLFMYKSRHGCRQSGFRSPSQPISLVHTGQDVYQQAFATSTSFYNAYYC